MNAQTLNEFRRFLIALRQSNSVIDVRGYYLAAGRCYGYLSALRESRLVDNEQYCLLGNLIDSAVQCSGLPFPDPRNAGPVMPFTVAFERRQAAARASVQAAEPFAYGDCDCTNGCDACDDDFFEHRTGVKPQAQVAFDESKKVSASVAQPGLRLLCLLVETRTGEKRSLPVHTLQPLPPRNRIDGQWTIDRYPCFVLRETQAKPATAEVLARCERQWQANPVRPALGSVRAGF